MENAYIKAMAYFEKYRIPTLADDSGLVVPSLGGEAVLKIQTH
jgi:XTP/dITP diphosphohydrolase